MVFGGWGGGLEATFKLRKLRKTIHIFAMMTWGGGVGVVYTKWRYSRRDTASFYRFPTKDQMRSLHPCYIPLPEHAIAVYNQHHENFTPYIRNLNLARFHSPKLAWEVWVGILKQNWKCSRLSGFLSSIFIFHFIAFNNSIMIMVVRAVILKYILFLFVWGTPPPSYLFNYESYIIQLISKYYDSYLTCHP